MSNKSKIEWTDTTWNPVTGCSKVSAGCKNCYAERVANRWWKDRKFTDVRVHPERLNQPLKWRKPRRVFVNSMSDLFHESIPDDFIDRVFRVMQAHRKHTFQILTKRPERMKDFLSKKVSVPWGGYNFPEPWGNKIWMGVSVEDQKTADERIPLLLQTPAAVRFISAEPLLGPIDLDKFLGCGWEGGWKNCPEAKTGKCVGLDWVICGGESGPGARPFDLFWARSLLEQCKAAGVAYFFKQAGSNPYDSKKSCLMLKETVLTGNQVKLKDRKGGDWSEWPKDLRVREFPK